MQHFEDSACLLWFHVRQSLSLPLHSGHSHARAHAAPRSNCRSPFPLSQIYRVGWERRTRLLLWRPTSVLSLWLRFLPSLLLKPVHQGLLSLPCPSVHEIFFNAGISIEYHRGVEAYFSLLVSFLTALGSRIRSMDGARFQQKGL